MENKVTGICPVCNGTCRMQCPDNLRDYGVRFGWYNYDKDTDTIPCDNCGSQYMFGKATGVVKLNQNGEPCKHTYVSRAGMHRCTTDHVCTSCGDSYMIDSNG